MCCSKSGLGPSEPVNCYVLGYRDSGRSHARGRYLFGVVAAVLDRRDGLWVVTSAPRSAAGRRWWKADLQKDITDRLTKAGQTPQSVNCAEDLVGEVDKTTRY